MTSSPENPQSDETQEKAPAPQPSSKPGCGSLITACALFVDRLVSRRVRSSKNGVVFYRSYYREARTTKETAERHRKAKEILAKIDDTEQKGGEQ